MVVFCSNTAIFAQYANLEFTENKGQWDKRVKFKGTMNDGAFFLEEKGFRVVQHDPKDIQKLDDYMHGFSENTADNSAARVAAPAIKAVIPSKKTVTVRSHAYDVEFV